jgi:hypothetical protein
MQALYYGPLIRRLRRESGGRSVRRRDRPSHRKQRLRVWRVKHDLPCDRQVLLR